MKVLAVCTFFATLVWHVVPATAQELSYLPSSLQMDVLRLRESSEGHLAELFYQNSASQASGNVDKVMSYEHPLFGLIEVHVEVRINAFGMAEVLTVRPLNPGHMVFPEGPIPVRDGEEVVVQIMGGLS